VEEHFQRGKIPAAALLAAIAKADVARRPA